MTNEQLKSASFPFDAETTVGGRTIKCKVIGYDPEDVFSVKISLYGMRMSTRPHKIFIPSNDTVENAVMCTSFIDRSRKMETIVRNTFNTSGELMKAVVGLTKHAGVEYEIVGSVERFDVSTNNKASKLELEFVAKFSTEYAVNNDISFNSEDCNFKAFDTQFNNDFILYSLRGNVIESPEIKNAVGIRTFFDRSEDTFYDSIVMNMEILVCDAFEAGVYVDFIREKFLNK